MRHAWPSLDVTASPLDTLRFASSSERDCHEVYRAEMHNTLAKATEKVGKRPMESMFWAWLHALLRTERKWHRDMSSDRALLEHMRKAPRQGSTSPSADMEAVQQRIVHRIEDLQAIRRVTLFT